MFKKFPDLSEREKFLVHAKHLLDAYYWYSSGLESPSPVYFTAAMHCFDEALKTAALLGKDSHSITFEKYECALESAKALYEVKDYKGAYEFANIAYSNSKKLWKPSEMRLASARLLFESSMSIIEQRKAQTDHQKNKYLHTAERILGEYSEYFEERDRKRLSTAILTAVSK